MAKEAKAQLKVGVSIKALWKALAKDLRFILPNIMPSVQRVEMIEGDGGLGSVWLLHLDYDVPIMRRQMDKIVALDESQHQFGLQIVEGVILKRGFSSFKTIFQLSETGEQQTLVDIKVMYETETEDDMAEMAEMATKPALYFVDLIEKYLLK